MPTYTATYSPDDNKLRLSASSRLDSETYARVKDAGFKWAPKQEIFVAPMWTPAREDLLIELAGEIEDDDKTLAERAEERADRFDDYSDKRGQEAAQAHKGVQAIAGRFEFGQPILVGHHSERRARKDAERMENGMRRAVQLWDTSTYWASRAAGALAHAKYKELPAVRARRIKGLEADKRKQERTIADARAELASWQRENLTMAQALQVANYSHISRCFTLTQYPRNPPATQYEGPIGLWSALDGGIINADQAKAIAIPSLERTIAHCTRWLTHYENRIAYETAMLGEQGGLAADKFDIQPGGRVLIGGEWLVVLRVNKRAGKITSVRTTARFVPVRNVEEIADYQAPSAEEARKVATATKIAPLTNYPGEGFASMTSEEWDKVPKDYRGTKTIEATETTARHRVRICMGAYCMPSERDFNKRHAYPFVFISNAKRVDPPAAQGAPQPLTFERQVAAPAPQPAQLANKSEQALQMEDMRATLKAGVKVVTAPQLFPTPAALAEEMATEAQIEEGMTVCDFSAGTAALLAGVHKVTEGRAICTAVEINAALCDHIRGTGLAVAVHQADFLTLRPETFGRFQRIVLNPPFANAEDIAHIEHAIGFLEPGGRITAICANGPRQAQRLGALAQRMGGTFRALPEGVFLSSGTNVRAALFVANVNQEERAQA